MHTFSLLALFGFVALVLSAPVKQSGTDGRRPTSSKDSSDTGADYSDPQSSSNNNNGGDSDTGRVENGLTLAGDIDTLQRLANSRKFSTSTLTPASDNSNNDEGGRGDAEWPSATADAPQARKKSSLSKSTPPTSDSDDHQDWPSTRSPFLVPGAFGEANFPSVNQVYFDNLAKYTGGAYDWDEGHQTSTMTSNEGGRRSGLRRTSTQTPSTGGEDTNTNSNGESDNSSSPRPDSLDKNSENEESRRPSNNRRSTPRTVVVVDQPVVVVKQPNRLSGVRVPSPNNRPIERVTLPPLDY